MTYFTSIPQPTDKRSDSQGDFLSNFGALNTIAAVDHVPFATGTDTMYHKKISISEPLGPFPSTDPAPLFPNLSSPIASLFTMVFSFLRGDVERTAQELFYQNGATASDVFQLTNRTISVRKFLNTERVILTSIKTPWGLTINMGVAGALGLGVNTYGFPAEFTYAAGGHYTTVLTIGNNVQFPKDLDSFKVSNLTDTGFDFQYTGTVVNIGFNEANFISIGKTA